jgi:hypothetical protein
MEHYFAAWLEKRALHMRDVRNRRDAFGDVEPGSAVGDVLLDVAVAFRREHRECPGPSTGAHVGAYVGSRLAEAKLTRQVQQVLEGEGYEMSRNPRTAFPIFIEPEIANAAGPSGPGTWPLDQEAAAQIALVCLAGTSTIDLALPPPRGDRCPSCGVGVDTDGDGDCANCGPRKRRSPSTA